MAKQPTALQVIRSATEHPQELIFRELADISPDEKSLKTARIWLYVIAAWQAGIGVYECASAPDPDLALFAGIIDIGIGVLFLLLAFWSYRKPAVSFITALIAYGVIHVGLMFVEPTNLFKGLIMKVLIATTLAKAYKDAREVEKLKELTRAN